MVTLLLRNLDVLKLFTVLAQNDVYLADPRAERQQTRRQEVCLSPIFTPATALPHRHHDVDFVCIAPLLA